MKKLFAILAFIAITMNATAQNLYTIGYYKENGVNVAAVYKNGEKLYTSINHSIAATPTVIICDSEENVYWMVNRDNYTEIYRNDQLFVSTADVQNVHIRDIYCLRDTLYYAGYQTNEEAINVATVWKGTDMTPYWVLGDGVHDSRIFDADIDKWTGIPYFCGYINEDKQNACVWQGHELLFTCQDSVANGYQNTDALISSYATVISVDDGCIYALGCATLDSGWDDLQAIWNDGEIKRLWGYQNPTLDMCYSNGTLYEIYIDGYGFLAATGINLNSYNALGANKFRAGNYDIYLCGQTDDTAIIWKNGEEFLQIPNCSSATDVFIAESPFSIDHSEWYYEIENEDGTITYQHLEYTADTTIGTERPKVIVRSNTQYDRDEHTNVTHEYILEDNGKVYWWNKELEEFTVLYDLAANAGDEWEIKVGTQSLVMHVDTVRYVENGDRSFRVLQVSDSEGLFCGDIVCGIGHMTSFFPERLMRDTEGFRVNGLRCYWVGDELIYHEEGEDCDAVYAVWHEGIEEDGPSTPSTGSGALVVYPNPANDALFVETHGRASQQGETYRITNVMGQPLMTGTINAVETWRAASLQRIDISGLPAGMYFITAGGQTVKFVTR